MSTWLTHPIVGLAALIVGGIVGWRRGRKPLRVDVTIRHSPKESEEDGTDS